MTLDLFAIMNPISTRFIFGSDLSKSYFVISEFSFIAIFPFFFANESESGLPELVMIFKFSNLGLCSCQNIEKENSHL